MSVSCFLFETPLNLLERKPQLEISLDVMNLQVLQLAKAMEAQDYVTASKVQQECFPQKSVAFLSPRSHFTFLGVVFPVVLQHSFSPTDLGGGFLHPKKIGRMFVLDVLAG